MIRAHPFQDTIFEVASIGSIHSIHSGTLDFLELVCSRFCFAHLKRAGGRGIRLGLIHDTRCVFIFTKTSFAVSLTDLAPAFLRLLSQSWQQGFPGRGPSERANGPQFLDLYRPLRHRSPFANISVSTASHIDRLPNACSTHTQLMLSGMQQSSTSPPTRSRRWRRRNRMGRPLTCLSSVKPSAAGGHHACVIGPERFDPSA